LPVYNGERFLPEALDSLLGQSFQDFELIVSDNASTDSTAHICRMYAARDGRIRYIRNETNVGVYRNCNAAFHAANGEYFKLAAADDLCDPRLLAACVDVLDRDPSVVATYSKTRFIGEDGNSLGLRDPGWHLMSDSPLERMRYVIWSGHWVNVFFGLSRCSALAKTRLFPLYAGGDCRLLGELSLRGKFFEIAEYLFFRRIHAAASSQNPDLEWQSRFYKGRPGRVELPFWHICLDHISTILRADLSAHDKVSCLGMVAGRMRSGKRQLFEELRRAAKYLYRRLSLYP